MKKIILLLLIIPAFLPATGQDMPDSLLLKYREMALANNDDLRAAEKNITASIELEKTVRADRGPKLAVEGNFQYTGNPVELNLSIPGTTATTFRGQELQYGFSATLVQPVYTGNRILESIRMAQTRQWMASTQKELLQTFILYQTDVQYWSTVARREMVEIATDFRDAIASLTRIIRERVEAGLSDPQDLLISEVKLNEAEYQLLQSRNYFETGRMALNSLIGIPLNTPTEISRSVARIGEVSSITGQPREVRSEIELARQQIELEKSNLKLNDAQFKPRLYVGASGGYYAPGYNFHPDLSPNYTLYAQLNIPIFEWGKRRNLKRASEQQIGMAADHLRKIETQVELETHTACAALTQAVQRTGLAHASLAKALENERRATEKYNEGAISVSEVIDAQVYRQTAQINYVEAKAAAQLHYAEWQKAANSYETR